MKKIPSYVFNKKKNNFIDKIKNRIDACIYFFSKLGKKEIIFIISIGAILFLMVIYYFLSSSAVEKKLSNWKASRQVAKMKDSCLKSSDFSWCKTSSKCIKPGIEFCADEVLKLVSDIKNNTGISFSDIGETNFAWSLSLGYRDDSDKNIKGEAYSAESLKLDDVKKVERYLESVSKLSLSNIADGVAGGLRGYNYRDLACVLDFRYKEMKNNEEGVVAPVSDNMNVRLKCGLSSS